MSDASIAASLGVGIAYVRAIRYVESGGAASAVRFEPHLFWRRRLGMPDGTSGVQVRNALTDEQLRQVPYTPGNTAWRAAHGLPPCRIDRSASCTASETNRAAFDRAYAVDPINAVRATSWGTFQILGGDLLGLFNNDTARAVAAFTQDPVTVSESLLVRYLRFSNTAALSALRVGNVPLFVALYNGCCGPHPRTVGGQLQRADGTPCTACDGYITKFRRGLTSLEPAAEAAGGGLLLAAAAGLGFWWWSRRR